MRSSLDVVIAENEVAVFDSTSHSLSTRLQRDDSFTGAEPLALRCGSHSSCVEVENSQSAERTRLWDKFQLLTLAWHQHNNHRVARIANQMKGSDLLPGGISKLMFQPGRRLKSKVRIMVNRTLLFYSAWVAPCVNLLISPDSGLLSQKLHHFRRYQPTRHNLNNAWRGYAPSTWLPFSC